ncbi:TolC family outer membrane protein [Nitrogeniibacter mangrovi]|uniref:TolC family outer membrane protein n=1 Tax=Nitrogeniibacter mangrovi TaxID=2016596 RepID=A0A6C1B494_9RHOO|nr:TolC family outer membrane protein [Nitrogeniibacter mangrovi]QID17100.1 TolC family outer membrane protein [Nitrogeniibacter mangrovi]
MKNVSRIAAVLLACALPFSAAAEPAANLRDAVKRAVVTNPDVQAAWHGFLAAQEAQGVAQGGYYPRVDLTAGIGREHQTDPGVTNRNYTRRGATLSLSQMVYDGFATASEVARLDHAKLTRYFELLDASEQAALETVRAYADVERYRELVRLARDNYARHKEVFDQIEARVRAGVGRRVDFEQAAGRLALAESNLLTEASNLHDVSARYQRIVGELPADTLAPMDAVTDGIPDSIADALRLAYTGNPGFQAAIENVRSAREEARGKKSAFQPRVDLRARQAVDYNTDGIDGRHGDRVVELVFNYNLFNGGSDSATVRQYAQRLNQAQDLRDKACRDLRQTLAIAYNDVGRLGEQLGYLNQHQLSIGKAREAYRRQFDIGQRTLLDLLDTENEYFQARRAYVIAEYDHTIARARALTGLGKLLGTLGVTREDLPALSDLSDAHEAVDPATACPAVAPPSSAILKTVMPVDKIEAQAPSAAESRPAPVDTMAAALEAATRDWAAAWSGEDFSAYRGFYSARFRPEDGQSVEAWEAERRARLDKPGKISVTIEALQVQKLGPDIAATVFTQRYRADDYQDVVTKRLEWVRENDRWRITREVVQ